jgi:Holliday junction resolvase RusA-like endonuclease
MAEKRIELNFDVLPIAKGRPRFKRKFNRQTKLGYTSVRTPLKTKQFEKLIQILAKKQLGNHKPFDAPVQVAIAFGFIPPVHPKFAPEHAIRPDLDNLVKSVLDGLNGIAWTDDALIWKMMAIKSYSDQDHITVIINGKYKDDPDSKKKQVIPDAELSTKIN